MAYNSWRISLDPGLYEAAKNGDMNILKEIIFPRSILVDGEIAVPVAGGALVSNQHRRFEHQCLLGVTHGGDTALHIAARFGHLQVAKLICNINVSLLVKDNDKSETPLHYAAKAGECDLVTYFIELAKSIRALGDVLRKRNRHGETALYQAILYKHPDVVEEFRNAIENQVFSQLVSIPNNENISPLYLAIMHGQSDIVTSLIESLREVEDVPPEAYAGPDGQTVLHAAAQRIRYIPAGFQCTRAFCQKLIKYIRETRTHADASALFLQSTHAGKVIISIRDHVLNTLAILREYLILITAIRVTRSHANALFKQLICTGFVQKVLDWKPELAKSTDKSGSTALHYAAASCNLEAISAILQTDITCAYMADSSGLYPVHLAVKMGSVEVVATLFDLCPDLDQLPDNNGRNFVHLAVEEQEDGIVRWICRKSELTEAMNAQDNNGDTAIHLAVKAGQLNIFAHLLGTGKAHLSVTNKDGSTPLDLAISKMTVGFFDWQNPDRTMIRILNQIRCCQGIKRRDHFVSEHRLKRAQMKEKMVEQFDSMAKTNAIGAVLIASAAFAGAFSVSAAYRDIKVGHESASLDFTFMSFIIMVGFAFVCSIVATSIIMQSALTFLAPIYREKYILMCHGLIIFATMAFVASFAIGVYIVLSPVSKWLAYLVCTSLAVVPVLFDPHLWPNCLLIRALIKYLGWKGLWFGCYSLQFFTHQILFSIFVLLVLLGSFEPHLRVVVLVYGTAIIFFGFFLYFIHVRNIIRTI